MLMTLGLFVWSLPTLSYQQLQRQTQWRYAANNRVGKRPARQFVGPGDDSITLSGWIAPELAGDPLSIAELRLMGDGGKPYPLVSANGDVYGLWQIESLSESQTLFYPNGDPRKLEFSLRIKRVDDDRIDQVGLIIDPSEVIA